MRFAPTEDQIDLAMALRKSLAGGAAEGEAGRALADMGVCGLLLQESSGGAGADESLLVTVLTEAGYAGVPLPLVDTLAFAPGILLAAGLDDVAAEVAAGELWCAADLSGRGLVPSRAGLVFTMSNDAAVDVRWIQKRVTTDGDAAAGPERRDVGDPKVGSEPSAGTGPFLSAGDDPDPHPAGEEAGRVATVDPRADLVRWDLRALPVVGSCVDADVILRSRQRASVGAAAQLVGLARRMLDLTTAYVKERHQFGVPVGSFQAIKHHLADVSLAVEFAAPVVASAAAMLSAVDVESGSAAADDVRLEVSAAKVLASDAAMLAARRAIQCHGAIGYTTEYELHLYVKQAWALAASWGSADDHREVVAGLLGLGD